jgi:hypothetical protein
MQAENIEVLRRLQQVAALFQQLDAGRRQMRSNTCKSEARGPAPCRPPRNHGWLQSQHSFSFAD